MREEQERLRACFVEPVEVRGAFDEWAQAYLSRSGEVRSYVLIARDNTRWLLYDPGSGDFALAHGESLQKPLSLLGMHRAMHSPNGWADEQHRG